jgi:hypothetical protein
MRAPVFTDNPLHHPPHRIGRCVHFTELPDLTAPLTVGNRNGVARFCHIDPDENIYMLVHGSSSCDEDRLGHPEQPSETQYRASYLKYRGGHTVLPNNHWSARCS